MARPSKGPRHARTVRFPEGTHYPVYVAAAEQAGMDFNAYVNWVLAQWHELPAPEGEPGGGDQLQMHYSAGLEGAA